MNSSEGEAAEMGKGSSEEEGLLKKATLASLVSALENISRKLIRLTHGLTLTS